MNHRELNDLLWRSCYLGMRLGLELLGGAEAQKRLDECLRRLGEVARGEATLHDAHYSADGSNPGLAGWLIALQNHGVGADRDLASAVVAGLEATKKAEDGAAGEPTIHYDRPPLRVDQDGVIRVGHGRVPLDLVVGEYERGKSPEEIVRAHDVLRLADVYAGIAYYLRHRKEVAEYLARRVTEAEAWKAKVEAERPRVGREELLARRAAAENAHAPAGQ